MKRIFLFIALLYSSSLFAQATYNFHSYKLCKVDSNNADYDCNAFNTIPPIETLVINNQDSIKIKFGAKVNIAHDKDERMVSQEWDDNNVVRKYDDGRYVYEFIVPYTQPAGAVARVFITFNKNNTFQMLSYETTEGGVSYNYLVYP